ncbi:rhomboid family intramembrane serine protease [Chitinophaga horti]|uniref:Rhomboid family intramembrane serine protease n=1 Tax=Chitinophaga horti TaxID=2920382 RepID=A0ABY6J0J0_9BACT|nr:rhomboid family intramembrane serine protease [Chitinophaga horti]UYQ91667.1 rhomboid family intramembrane serine protease [Chitinophaga horti]
MNGTSLRSDVRSWLNQDNTVNHIILWNTIIFLVIGILNLAALGSGGAQVAKDFLLENLSLQSNLVILAHKPWGFITYMFTHEGVFHYVFNMMALYFFGNLFRSDVGRERVLPVYIISSIFAGLLYVMAYNIIPALSVFPNILIGASASIMCFITATAMTLPNLVLNIFFINIRLKWLAIALVVIDILSIAQGNTGGIIAHLGGALFGILYVLSIRNGVELAQPLIWLFGKLGSISFKRQPAPKSGYRNFKPKKSPLKVVKRSGEENRQQKLDILLDKINEKGYDSLTHEEKSWLKKYSNENS